MPNPLPEFQIQNFLSRHTLSLAIRSLPTGSPQDRECPICQNRYSDPPVSYAHPDCPSDVPEYACQVTTCNHIFGRRCLEKHIRDGNPWSHTCPMCRKAWLTAPNRGRTEVMGHIERALNSLASLEVSDVEVRREVENVEQALAMIRDVLNGNRWV
jgi:hypothetical protein